MRLLLLFLDEPLPGQVMKEVEKTAGPEAAVRSYRAMIRVLLRQLSGLKDCRVRICYAPEDAEQAFRFWILPEIIDRPKVLLTPEDLDFVAQGPGPRPAQLEHHFAIAFEEGFEKVAAIGSECIEISARWINAAFSPSASSVARPVASSSSKSAAVEVATGAPSLGSGARPASRCPSHVASQSPIPYAERTPARG